MMGGGFDQISTDALPLGYPLSVAARVILPANDPRTDHVLEFKLSGPGKPEMTLHGMRFSRQNVAPPHESNAIIAAHTLITVDKPGEFQITATVDSGGAKSYVFRVFDTPAVP